MYFMSHSGFVAAITGIVVACFCDASQAADRPNVLFIAIDDLRTELGCYGLPYVDSPHLDQLAREGTLFNNHFVQVATCGASRYALLTGRSPAESGAVNNAAMYSGPTALTSAEQPGAQSMPELFRRSGYHTTLIGKISHTADGRVYAYDGKGNGADEIPLAWDDKATPLGSWKRGWGVFFAYGNGRHREDGKGHNDLMEFSVENDDDLPDGLMANVAIEKLKGLAKSDKPFFMGLGFFKPHLPFVAPKQDWEAMKNRDIPAPPHPEKVDSPHWHKSGEFYKYESTITKTHPLSPHDTELARKAYLACVRYVDRQVGRVLAGLHEAGVADNTIVVVWGDHGWQLGDSALWAKHTPFERSNHSTLIIRAPGISRPGQACDALVESIDLYPTLIDLCQPSFQETVHPLNGVSLRPLLDGSADSVKPVAISYWRDSISVRSPTHRLIVTRDKRGRDGHTELYDIRKTPDPIANMANAHADLVSELSAFLPKKR
jgi:arylsulfatase A-like enzyme